MSGSADQGPAEARPWRFLAILFASFLAFVVVGRYLTGTRDPLQHEQTPSRIVPRSKANAPAKRFIERGKEVFTALGCAACHGAEGQGGVDDLNYVAGAVPALDQMADRLMLLEPEDARIAVELLERGDDLVSPEQDPPFPDYQRFVAQYDTITNVIMGGARAAKKDPAGPTPPLQMPAWRDHLSDEDLRALIAYLIELYDWEE